jgi:hypothetical protein
VTTPEALLAVRSVSGLFASTPVSLVSGSVGWGGVGGGGGGGGGGGK